jgi:hypothetical protein
MLSTCSHRTYLALSSPSYRLALISTGALTAHAIFGELSEEVCVFSALLALAHYLASL